MTEKDERPIFAVEEILDMHDLAMAPDASPELKQRMLTVFSPAARIALMTNCERVQSGSTYDEIVAQRQDVLDGIKKHWQDYFKDQAESKDATG